MGATLNGLTTIRASNKQEILQKEFCNIQDANSGSFYLLITGATSFNLYVDMLSAIFMTCIVSYYLLIEIDGQATSIGLAISQAMRLTGALPWGKKCLLRNDGPITPINNG